MVKDIVIDDLFLSDFKNGKFSREGYKKRKLTAGDRALVFTKDLEISLFGRFGHWTVSDCGRMQ